MIFVPSRNRRASLERFFSVSCPTLEGRVLIDDDDKSYKGMVLPEKWEFFIRPRDTSVKIINRAFREWPNEMFYGEVSDDMICGPLGWDVELSEKAQGCNVAWGNDGRWGGKLCTSFFIGGDLVRAFGWLAHPSFGHLYADTIWWMIAKGAGIDRYCPKINMTHINVKDQTYRERRTKGDQDTFDALRKGSAIDELIMIASELKGQ